MRRKYQQSLNKSKFNQNYIEQHPGKNDKNDSDKNNSINAIKEQVGTSKEKSTSVKSNNQSSEKSENQISKTKPEKTSHIEIIRDSMLNGIYERGMNKFENINLNIRKYPGASSIDILDHFKLSLRKASEQIIIHGRTNDISNDTSYLKNV